MYLLAIETTGPKASAALLAMPDGHMGQGGQAQAVRLLGETSSDEAKNHLKNLLPLIRQLLTECNVPKSQLTHIAASIGPGSFTGIRIGVAAAKGLAWGAELPCCGTSTLASMAVGLGVWQGYVCPVMDARRGQVYNALFHVDCGKYTRVRDDRAISLRDLAEDVKNLAEPIFLVGDGSILCYNTLPEMIPALVLPPEHRMHQRATGVALEAQRMLQCGECTDAAGLVPNYLRLSQAERERNERMQNQ